MRSRDPKERYSVWKTFVNGATNMWLIVGVTFLLLLCVELGSTMLLVARRQIAAYIDPRAYIDFRSYADSYPDPNWGVAYFKELSSLPDLKWHPYIYWRRPPFKGYYTNIDAQGLRRTWKGNTSHPTKPLRIFMFGGSTMLGTGADDDATIPSIVAKALAVTYSLNVDIINFGAMGYVTTQEIIALMRELQRGNIPDLVIFYDGGNDTFSTYQNAVAGLPQNEWNREREFNLSHPNMIRRLYKEALLNTVINSATFQVLRSLIRRTTGHELLNLEAAFSSYRSDPPTPSHVATETARIYDWNVRFVSKIGDAYGFRTLFYWQPLIFNKNNLTSYEQELYNKLQSLAVYYRNATTRAKTLLAGFDGFHDISDVFAGHARPYFVDQWHLSGAGNEVIARRMLRDVAPIAQELAATRAVRQTSPDLVKFSQ